ncbi:MAG: thioredoxin domain-containing protein [Pseudomonadota bacterium]
MRQILLAMTLLLAACSQENFDDLTLPELSEGSRPIVAALSYASWCPSCRTLDPRIEAVRERRAFENITFVTLDYTKKDQGAFFSEAETQGVGQAIRDHFADGIYTGRLFLIDPDTQMTIATVDSTMGPEAIYEALIKATYDESIAG